MFDTHIADQRAIDAFLSMVEDEPALLLENHTVVDGICRTPIEQKVWRSSGKGSCDGTDAPQTRTRSMSFEQVHVIGEELTAQIASASFSSRMRLRSSSAETQKRIGVYR